MQATKCGIKLEMKNKLNFHIQLYLRKTQFDVILKCDSVSNLLYHKHSQDISSSEEDSKKKKTVHYHEGVDQPHFGWTNVHYSWYKIRKCWMMC